MTSITPHNIYYINEYLILLRSSYHYSLNCNTIHNSILPRYLTKQHHHNTYHNLTPGHKYCWMQINQKYKNRTKIKRPNNQRATVQYTHHKKTCKSYGIHNYQHHYQHREPTREANEICNCRTDKCKQPGYIMKLIYHQEQKKPTELELQLAEERIKILIRRALKQKKKRWPKHFRDKFIDDQIRIDIHNHQIRIHYKYFAKNTSKDIVHKAIHKFKQDVREFKSWHWKRQRCNHYNPDIGPKPIRQRPPCTHKDRHTTKPNNEPIIPQSYETRKPLTTKHTPT